MSGRHIVVTGGGTGIGRAIAARLAADGARLSLLARDTTRLERTAEDVGGAWVSACDIRDPLQVEAAFDAATEALGPIDALVANAGVGGPNEPGPGDRWDDLVGTNLTGTYHCLRAAQARLAQGPEPRRLLVVSSVLARFGVPGYTGYCASKAGLLGLVRALSLELAEAGVRVNALCPGWVDTQMARDGIQGLADTLGISWEEAHAQAMADVPLGRMSTPEEVAGAVAWLLSNDASTITGQAIDINGGAWMG